MGPANLKTDEEKAEISLPKVSTVKGTVPTLSTLLSGGKTMTDSSYP